MSRRKVNFVQDHYYHCYNRGANKEPIFRTDDNYIFLLGRIRKYSQKFNISIIAYCLMPNHYHFLLRQDSSLSISDFLQAVFNSYTKAFNKANNRRGTLFEERFKAINIDKDSYLLHLCRYIHRNPLDAGLVIQLDDWQYSNYLEWIGKRNGTLVDCEFVNEQFGTLEEYELFVMDYPPPKEIDQAMGSYYLD
ncbi:MAG: transposase [Chloroflexota bacterium]|nr:transposase [Chloroflexota bacterium]